MNASTDPLVATEAAGEPPAVGPPRPAPGVSEVQDAEVEAMTSAGFRSFQRYTYWSLVSAALTLLVFPALVGPIPYPPDPLGMASLAAVIATALALVRLAGHHIPPRPEAAPLGRNEWWAWAAIGSVASLTLAAIWVSADDHFMWAFGPAMIVSLIVASFPKKWRRVAILVGVATATGAGVAIGATLSEQGPEAMAVTAALVTGFAMMLTLATIWSWRIVVQLHDAKRTAATLAVANERLRFAADLHDIQGHNLQVIALKSELAHRLLRHDPAGAEREIAAVQELAAAALRDTRAVVQGYRRATLDAEITNATAVLGSAGIDSRLHVAPELRDLDEDPDLSADARHLLGLVVREAVTNLLRHSNATWATVDLSQGQGAILLTIANDGVDDRPHRASRGGDGQPPSGGLDDLAERLRAVGGTLTWQRDDARFEVQAHLPTSGVT